MVNAVIQIQSSSDLMTAKVMHESNDIFIFQRLISLKNNHINLNNVNYCVRARLRKHIMGYGHSLLLAFDFLNLLNHDFGHHSPIIYPLFRM